MENNFDEEMNSMSLNEDMGTIPEEVELSTEEISFDDGGDVVISDETHATMPVMATVVEEETIPVMSEDVETTEYVAPVQTVETEETIQAPVAVEEIPEETQYVAPIEEPVHHVRWPWALLALPLLAIPFIPRHTTEPVAEPVVVRTVAPAARAVPTTPSVAVPTCDGHWTTTSSVPLRETAGDTGRELSTLATGTAVDVKAAESGWYKVMVGSDSGYLPVNMVVCTVEKAVAPAVTETPRTTKSETVAPTPAEEEVARTTVTG